MANLDIREALVKKYVFLFGNQGGPHIVYTTTPKYTFAALAYSGGGDKIWDPPSPLS